MAGCKQSQPLLRDDGFRGLSLKCDGLKAKQKEYQNQIFVILAVLRRSMQRVTRPNTATTRLGYSSEETSQRWLPIRPNKLTVGLNSS